MKFMFLLYGDESAGETPSKMPEERGAAWQEFHSHVETSGALVTWQALQPTDTAKTLRNVDGKPVSTDGPYVETKEQLGGFYMLECRDFDEALLLAAKMPCSAHASIEVRPVLEQGA